MVIYDYGCATFASNGRWPVHEAQLLTYLRLLDKRLGPLLNFNVPVLVKGIHRVVNNLKLSLT